MDLLNTLIENDSFKSLESESRRKMGLYEKPVDIETFLYDKDYLGLNIRLSARQLKALKAIDNIDPKTNKVTEIILQWGKGSGKDLIVNLTFSRTIYLLLCLPNPLEYFGLADFETLDLLNVAVSADQAKDVFFVRLKNVVRNAGPKAYKQFGFNPDTDILQSRINFPKSIIAYSGHSKQESQEGKNYFLCVIDEASQFLLYRVQNLYNSLRTSINTRFPGVGKLCVISYATFKGDYIQRKYNDAEGKEHIYRDKASTWDVNPMRKRSDFDNDFRDNPEKAKAMYMCDPEMSGDAYIKDLDKIAKIFINDIQNPTDEMGRFKEWFGRDVYLPKRYFMHVDLALGRVDDEGFRIGDVAALAMGYLDGDIVKIIYQKIYEGLPGGEVQFEQIKEDIIYLKKIKQFNITKCTFDSFNSAKIIQELNSAGISSEILSVDRGMEPYDTFKTMILQEKVKAYVIKGRIVNTPTNNVLKEELENLILLDAKKVDHLETASKDLSDAICGVVYHCVKLENAPQSNFSWTTVRG